MISSHAPSLVTMVMIAHCALSAPTLAQGGDFNGDGRDDLVIMVPNEDIGAVGGSNAGAVHVIYGRGSGLKATGDQFWHQDVSGIPSTASSNKAFGCSTAAGDFDGDGRDDLAIGAYGETVDGQAFAGAVHVLHGRGGAGGGGGLSSVGDQFFSRATAGVQGAPEANELFGHTLAAGDFDGDGRDDLAIGMPYADAGLVASAGAVLILYGSSSGLTANGDQVFSQDSPGILDQSEPGDQFGRWMTVGDFDGDGRDDLAISSYVETINGHNNAGAVNVLYGSGAGLSNAGDQFWHQDSPGIASNAQPSEFFGWAMAAGDFDGDGRDDLAIGAFNEVVNGVDDTGAVSVLYGSSNGLRAAGDQFFSQDTAGIKDKCDGDEYFGCALAAGDFDGDGFDDLAIGACYENVGVHSQAGAINVIYGSSNGLSANDDQFLTQGSPGVAGSAGEDNYFGGLLSSGDFDGDGRDDLAVVAPETTVSGVDNAGLVHVFYGSNGGISTAGDQRWTQDTSGVQDEAENQDYLGLSTPGLP